MPLVSSNIPNLINGVSQQSPSLRLITQCDEQINAYPTVIQGLKKRPPRRYIGSLSSTISDSAFTHIINRDADERYSLVISDGNARVFDIQNGTEKTVHFPAGKGYLNNANPKTGFRAVTVADYTFITNRSVVTSMSGAIYPGRNHEALIVVRGGNYGRWYRIRINGTEVASFRPGDGVGTDPQHDLETVDTVHIAKALGHGATGVAFPGGHTAKFGTNLATNLPAGFEFAIYSDVIHIVSYVGDFTIATDDGFSEQGMYNVKGETQSFSKLPTVGPTGFVVKVFGSEGNDQDHYYVQFNGKVWRECPKPGVLTSFNQNTMPHILVSEADGTFTFKPAEWDPRVAGDAETIPPPSFIGWTISDVTFHKNRLGLISDETFIASRSGDFFNFWAATAMATLDDDPIDVGTTHDKVSILNFAVPWANDLFLFSDQSQFALKADGLLTPKSVSIDPTTEFESSALAKPLSSGRFIYFAADRGDYSSIHEYYLMDDMAGTYDTNDITGHVPAYVPTGIFKLTSSTAESVIVALTEREPNAMYVYCYYWSQNEKLQSAWGKWVIEEGSTILNAEVLNSELILLVRYSNGQVAIESIPLDPAAVDIGAEYLTLLDRRVDSADLPPRVYDPEERTTSFVLPYQATDIQVASKDGHYITVESVSDSTVVIEGDHRETDFYVGVPYTMRYRFSEFFVREEATGGGIGIKTGGRIQLRYLTLVYNETAHFTVEVTADNRPTYRYAFTGRRDGDSNNLSDVLSRTDGTFKVPLMSNSQGLVIDIVNDSPFPSKIISASWTANYVNRKRSI